MTGEPYATPRVVTDVAECAFYHTMDIPGHGHVRGDWDLAPNVAAYLGQVDFAGKRVLEVGTADGYLGFEMEARGAEVVCYDLSEQQLWDLVPFPHIDQRACAHYRQMIRKLN